MRPVTLLALVGTAACSQQVYSPPSQTYALGPIHTLAPGKQSLGVDVSSHAEIFDPALEAFGMRYRTGVTDDTEMSVEGTANVVDDHGPSTANRTFYSGRAGIKTNPGHNDNLAVFAGGGGGYAPSGGGFMSVDAGLTLGWENCYVVPVAQFSGFISQPLAPRPIDVSDESGHFMTDTPDTTYGGVIRTGLRVSLSPSRCHQGEQVPWLSAGIGSTALADHDSHAMLMGVGVGIELPL